MIPTITQVLPIYPTHIHVQWSIEDRTGSLGSVDVLRSGSPIGPFDTIASDITTNNYFYADEEPVLDGLTTHYWYIIKANNKINASAYALSPAKTIEYDLKGPRAKIARKARRDLKVQLERLNGVPLLILKKRRFGARCPKCFNQATNDCVFSHCNTCFSTTYDEGYHDPIRIFGKLDPIAIQPSMGSSGTGETAVTGLTIVDYPVVEPEDVVIEIKTNRRFKVIRKMVSESSRVLVHQDLQVSELARSAVEYEIPVELIYVH